MRIDLDKMTTGSRCAIRRTYRRARSHMSESESRGYVRDVIGAADRGNLSAIAVIDFHRGVTS